MEHETGAEQRRHLDENLLLLDEEFSRLKLEGYPVF
jgi:hypothetical protein